MYKPENNVGNLNVIVSGLSNEREKECVERDKESTERVRECKTI